MKKTVNITIGGRVFTIEEDAYEALADYLGDVQRHFAALPESDEIVSDIEGRIAERFGELLQKAGRTAVNADDVNVVVAALGKVEDFATAADEAQAAASSAPRKRLYRNADDVVIAGVASGIAAYFGIDPVVIRLLFVVTIFFGGTGIVVYLLLWLILPEAQTPSQKLEMAGDPVTLEKMEKTLKETLRRRPLRQSDARRLFAAPVNFVREVVRAFGTVLGRLVPLVSSIIGFCIILGTALAFAFVTSAAVNFVVNADSPYLTIDGVVALREIASGALYYVGVIAAYSLVAIPLIFLLIVGASLFNRKNALTLGSVAVLASIWIIGLATFSTVAFRLAPRIEQKVNELEQVGIEAAKSTYEVRDFTAVSATGTHQLTILRGDEFAVHASGRQRDIDRLRVSREGDTLLISTEHPTSCFIRCPGTQGVDITITMPALEQLSLGGATVADLKGFQSDTLELSVGGASRLTGEELEARELFVELQSAAAATLRASSTTATIQGDGAARLTRSTLTAQRLTLRLTSAAQAELDGAAGDADVELDGAARLSAPELVVSRMRVTSSNAARATINVTQTLGVQASGASRITYRGEPQLTEQEVSSAARLQAE